MKFAISLLFLSALQVSAFPSNLKRDALAGDCPLAKREELYTRLLQENSQKKKKKRSTFDAKAQYVDTTGAHAFVPPNLAGGDQRGPCPGLNALANHNYLPHNGVGTLQDFITATNTVFGMSLDLGGFLAVFGTVFDGNPISLTPGYSIGGATSQSQNILGNIGGLVGEPQGLSGSHNKYEGDTSPTRGDLYQVGNNYKVVVSQAAEYVNNIVEGIPSDQQYEKLFPYRQSRFDESIQKNPYFFFPPFAGILVAPAGYSFPKAMMANHSAQFPDGSLTKDNFKSFFALSGDGASLSYKEGWERIPDNWYRRPIGDDFSIPDFLVDVLDFGLQDPRLLTTGGNINGVNTYAPIDLSDLTGGVYSSGSLTQGNNLECFVFQSIQAAIPDVLGGTFSNVGQASQPLSDTIISRLAGLGCPQLQKIDDNQYEHYPGYTKSGGAV